MSTIDIDVTNQHGFGFLPQEVRIVPIDSIHPHEKNVNKADLKALLESVEATGYYGFIVAQKSTSKILAGNHRHQLAKQQGATEIPVSFVDVDDETALRILLADNRVSRLGSDDSDALAALLQSIREEEGSLLGTGFDDDALQKLLDELNHDSLRGSTGGEAMPVVPQTPVSAPGDLWLLGRHRLLCGRASDPNAVSRLLGKDVPSVMVTDVSGSAYSRQSRRRGGATHLERIGKVSGRDRSDCREAWALFPGNVAYIWHDALNSSKVFDSLQSCGFDIQSQIIWAQPSLGLGPGQYHRQHKPCWYALRGYGHWYGGRKQSTLWQVESRHHDAETTRRTQTPVECMSRPIINSSRSGEAIYDPFCGSGATIIACEAESRIALSLERKPVSTDMAVIRWQNFTGQHAVLEADGRAFDEIALERGARADDQQSSHEC